MQPDQQALERIRALYLKGTAGTSDYWQSTDDLAAYDATFAQRIGWKWSAVLGDLDRLEWKPPIGVPLVDIGCGSGIASRTVMQHYGAELFSEIHLHDRSPLAMHYAEERVKEEFGTNLSVHTNQHLQIPPSAVVVLSHILTELTKEQMQVLVKQLTQATAILWVEPGTHTAGMRLVAAREELFSTFGVVAPCTQQQSCPMLHPANARHWCHEFATPPTEAFTQSQWSEFADDFGIDLRRLAYSYCVFDKREEYHTATSEYRILGTPNVNSTDAVACVCNGATVTEIIATKKRAPYLYKALKKGTVQSPIPLQLNGRHVVE